MVQNYLLEMDVAEGSTRVDTYLEKENKINTKKIWHNMGCLTIKNPLRDAKLKHFFSTTTTTILCLRRK